MIILNSVLDQLLLFALIVNIVKLAARRVSTDNVKHVYLVSESTRLIHVLPVEPIARFVIHLPPALNVLMAGGSMLVFAQLALRIALLVMMLSLAPIVLMAIISMEATLVLHALSRIAKDVRMTIATDVSFLSIIILWPITALEFLIMPPIGIIMLLVLSLLHLARMAFMSLPILFHASHVLASVLDADCKLE